MSGVLRGSCCEICGNIPQKTPVDEITMKNKTAAFSERLQQFLIRGDICIASSLREGLGVRGKAKM